MYTIREATVTDVETIRQLANEIWWPTYSPLLAKDQIEFMLADRYSTETISTQIENGIQTYLLMSDDEQPIAFAAYSPDEKDPETYKLHKIYSLPTTKGKGVGKMLLNEVCNRVIAAGKHVLELNVQRQNPAKGFYEKMGFVVAYEVDIPFDRFFLNDYVMRKIL